MKKPALCHSESRPVGTKNPCSFFKRPVRQLTDACSLRTAEILRRPDQIGTPQDDVTGACAGSPRFQIPSSGWNSTCKRGESVA
jgi:hypothetical protein